MNRREKILRDIRQRSEHGYVFFRPILMQFAADAVGTTDRDVYLAHQTHWLSDRHAPTYFTRPTAT